ncbi:MAG: hypothetical protein AABZ74_16000, partial [Cyanobacteriota bacterium]
ISIKGSIQKNILSILNENTKDVKNESKTEDKTKTNNVNLKKGDDWGGGKVLAVNVDPTGYRNVSKGIEGGVYDTTFDEKSYTRFKSQESKGKAPAGKAEAYKQKHLLQNLQDCLSGKSNHVSLAFDKQLYENGTLKKGQKFRIPELEKAYGKSPIVFVAQDTGSDFTGKGFSRMDICTRDEKDPKTGKLYESDPRLNESKLTLVKMP